MLFSSMTFIFIFLPLLFISYFSVKKELRNTVLLIASIIFYAWGEPRYLAIMLLTIVINYLGAVLIDNYRKADKLFLILTVIADLSFLIYFKYFNFILTNVNNIFSLNISALNVVMPIGISFYTFQAMSYLIDVYRKEVKVQKDIYKLSLYICLFPQLVAGPIVKYHDVEEQINNREIDFESISLGVKRFIIGLSKKVLIANTMGAIADKIFIQSPDTFSHLTAWLGAVAYTFQIYFDFSGYSDMAIGLGLIFGFRFMENFNYPYISKSITEFWRRWHISLSTWFKQYVYISLGGNRNGLFATCRNLGIVFLLTGIWHGASWNFIVWGIWHGFFIILEKIYNIKEFEKQKHKIQTEVLMHLYCIFVFVIGWIFFRADNLHYALKYLANMFGILRVCPDDVIFSNWYYLGTFETIAFVAAILCSVPIFKNMLFVKSEIARIGVNVWLLVLFFFSTLFIAVGTYNPFIYFRF